VNYSNLTDETLLVLISRRQSDALSELYDRYHRLVFSLAFNSVGDRAVAEEITLDVFIRVWEKANTYRPGQAKVTTWLTSITRYRSIDILRQQSSRMEQHSLSWTELSTHPNSDENTPEEATVLSIKRERVRAALGQLPPEQRDALTLAYFKGYTHNQIAKLLDQPLGTIKTRIRLAMQKLRHILQDEWHGEQ
jgi:RNA polymerase sigma-70 factor (ECF subfamily)